MRTRQVILLNLLILVVILAIVGGAFWYFYDRSNYITVHDAHVSADLSYVAGTTAGKLTNWTLTEGSKVSTGDVIGEEQLPTGQTIQITAPASGEVLKNAAVSGEVIGQGTMLGAIADVQNEYITANIPETEVRNIKVGDTVDVYIDAYPGDSFSGTIRSIGKETAAATSVLPSGSSTGSFTKEVQRVPVKISISGKDGKYIIPQMSATVRIHR